MFYAAFLVALREGLEISLILGIIFSYLRGLNRKSAFRYIWIGAGSAFAISIIAGSILYVLTNEEEWSGQVYLETAIFFIATAILSYMTFWMKKNNRSLNKGVHAQIDKALNHSDGVMQLVGLAFITVIREGLELIMFLLALSIEAKNGAIPVSSGAIVGLIVATFIGWGIYGGAAKLNLKLFFQVMGNVLIIVAAGLLGNAIKGLIEMNILKPYGYLYDLTAVLNHHGAVGGLLHALVGYSDHLSTAQFLVWIIYLLIALVLFNRKSSKVSI